MRPQTTHLQIRSAFRTLLLATVLGGLAAPMAHALEIGLAPTEPLELPSLLNVDTRVEIQTRVIDFEGLRRVEFDELVRTIEFTDGPVELTAIKRLGLMSVHVKEFSEAGQSEWRALSSLRYDEPLLVESIQLKTFAGNGEDLGRFRFDLRGIENASPIPEPGAALLFAAGVTAVAVRSPRRR